MILINGMWVKVFCWLFYGMIVLKGFIFVIYILKGVGFLGFVVLLSIE